jgi:outer membrane biosynthesis protein TonB
MPAPPAAPAGAVTPPVNFGGPLTIRLETPPIVIQQIPPPPPVPAPEPEPEIEETPEEEEIIEVEVPEEKEEEQDNLFSYLDKLTKFLPTDKQSEYKLSDTRMKLAALKAKMAGDPGLLSKLQTRRNQTKTDTGSDNKVNLTKDKIGNTLNFMTGLTALLPDSIIAESLGNKLKNILSRLDNKTGEQNNEKSN